MKEFEKRKLIEPLQKVAQEGKPFLGVCLGLQVLFNSSEENPGVKGLGLLKGQVVKFQFQKGEDLRVPHIGWNNITFDQNNPLLKGIRPGTFFYFVHSYYCQPAEPEIVKAETSYGVHFASVIGKNRLWGVQFHPEKSQEVGLKLLHNFALLS